MRSVITVGPEENRVQHRRERRERIYRDQGGALAVTSALPCIHHPSGQRAYRRVAQLAEDVLCVGSRYRVA